MKKLIFLFLMLICCFNMLIIKGSLLASSETGHSDFQEIIIPKDSNAYLLVNQNHQYKQDMLKKVSKKFCGWSNYTDVNRLPVKYRAYTIFARSNNTSNPIDFDYQFKSGTQLDTSINVSGNITTKISGKVKSINPSLDATIRADIGTKNKVYHEEKTAFVVTINPKTKVSLIVKGEAKLSSGASKYYFFGICFKKGNWEYLDVLNEYYELFEEKLFS